MSVSRKRCGLWQHEDREELERMLEAGEVTCDELDRKYNLVYLDFKIEDDHKDLVMNKSGHKTYSINDVYSNINESNNLSTI